MPVADVKGARYIPQIWSSPSSACSWFSAASLPIDDLFVDQSMTEVEPTIALDFELEAAAIKGDLAAQLELDKREEDRIDLIEDAIIREDEGLRDEAAFESLPAISASSGGDTGLTEGETRTLPCRCAKESSDVLDGFVKQAVIDDSAGGSDQAVFRCSECGTEKVI